MPKIFVFLDYYLPGYKAGGPVRTIANMVDRLGDNIDFWVLTRDRDIGDLRPYPNVVVDGWSQVGNAMLYYSSPGSLSFVRIQHLISEIAPNAIYLNSLFSTLTIKILILRWLGVLKKTPVILAPRGELSSGALGLKAAKKQLYLSLAFRIGLYRDLIWQASSSVEKQEIQQVVGSNCDICVAPNIPSPIVLQHALSVQRPNKTARKIRLVFLSRISPKKNLQYVLKMLPHCSGQVILDIYGPIEDKRYWRECEDIIAQMPANVEVHYCGPVSPPEVVSTLSLYHFFILPTLGENFGHVILEALAAGCPVIISNQTSWLELEAKRIGWDLPLDKTDRWLNVLQYCIDMDETSYLDLSHSAHQFALEWGSSLQIEQQNMALFMSVLR